MSDDPGRFPDDELTDWIRGHPEVWSASVDTPSSEIDEQWIDTIVERVITREGSRLRRRSRRLIGGGVAALLVAGGAVGAAALLRGGQPSRPEAGAVCRAEAQVDSEAVVLPTNADPIEACRRVWESGRFAQYMTPSGIPPLFACVGPQGAIEVFPGLPSVCDTLGLVPTDPTLTPENQNVVRLQERLVESINAAGCVDVGDAIEIAEHTIEDLGLDGWTVVREPGIQDGCAKAAVDSTTTRVVISNT